MPNNPMPDLTTLESLDPKVTLTQGSSYLYNSKINDYQKCPRYAWFRHHLGLRPKDKPRYFTIGSALHKAAEIGLQEGFDLGLAVTFPDATGGLQALRDILKAYDLQDLQALTEQELSLINNMYEEFFKTWEATPRTILAIEETMKHPLPPNPYFTHWTVKADQVFEDSEGVWNGDIKTTSGYGPSTAKQYHDSLQTKTYGRAIKEVYPDLRGAKIFVCTKKAVRCVEETIPFADDDFYAAELHMKAAFEDAIRMEETRDFPRRCTSCVNTYGHKCEFYPICMERAATNMAYVQDIIKNWYTQSNPDEHLELGKEA